MPIASPRPWANWSESGSSAQGKPGPVNAKLTRADLMPLERYALERQDFRRRAMAHKQRRRIALGDSATLLFEDRLTVQYQVQEMLRIERIFEPAGIQDELDAYNPLIPDGDNLKATLLLEFADPETRTRQLSRLVGIERRIYAEVAGFPRVFAHADDQGRSRDGRTAAVHYLRFEFAPPAIAAFGAGAALHVGIDDPRLALRVRIDDATCESLRADFHR